MYANGINSLVQIYETLIESTLLSNLDIKLVSIDEKTIKLGMPISDKVRQPFNMLHGGASMALAESAASIHALSQVDSSKYMPVTIEINGSHIQSASKGAVIAIAKLLDREWDDLIMYTVDILHEESSTTLSSIRVTSYYKKNIYKPR